jgi:hypothetical protein
MKNVCRFAVMTGLIVAAPAMGFAMESVGARYTLSMTRDYTPSPWTHEAGYLAQSKHKFVFGGKNLLLGWMELYNEPRDAAREDRSVMKGIGRGIVNAFGDMVGGAAHVITFPITALDVPLPEGGTDLL